MEDIFEEIQKTITEKPENIFANNSDEIYLKTKPENFKAVCMEFHKKTASPIFMMFATEEKNNFLLYCAYLWEKKKKWLFIFREISKKNPVFDSLSKDIYSSFLFEREIMGMFGIKPEGLYDTRRLRLNGEVWPKDYYPLKKDFVAPDESVDPVPFSAKSNGKDSSKISENEIYPFSKVSGEGVFEVPVGPVHAGIIGPGHFRFSVSGEPIINLEARLGFTHRGVEKLFENKNIQEALPLSECIVGDSAFSHSLAFCLALEKISNIAVSENDSALRSVCLELERIYNHINDIGGIATDVGFSFPSMAAAAIKEKALDLNDRIFGNRYLKNINRIGGLNLSLGEKDKKTILDFLKDTEKDLLEIEDIMYSSVSFMDRCDTTGILSKSAAETMGIVGLPAKASGLAMDLRKIFPGIYKDLKFKEIKLYSGDVLARLTVRFDEIKESVRLLKEILKNLKNEKSNNKIIGKIKKGFALGYCESWRGPVLYWLKTDEEGRIDRCKIVDPSFHNWAGLCECVQGNIVPDFPLCNKSFDLSYTGNDL